MRTKRNYEKSLYGLSPLFLAVGEVISGMFVSLYQESQQAAQESQIVDTEYEEVKPNLLPQNTQNDD